MSLILDDDEIRELAGGYRRSDRQLAALHARGFVRAWRSPLTGKVVLERAHVDAVLAGQAPEPVPHTEPGPNWSRA